MQQLVDFCKSGKLKKYQNLFTNTSWLLGTEMVAKLSRLVTIIALASFLSLEQYGTAMLALAFHEVIRLIMRCGAGSQIVQCSQQKLESYAANGASVQWLLCLFLCLLQFVIAYPISHFYGNDSLLELIQAMAWIYLLYPIVSVNVFMIQRQSKMRYLSIRNAACIISENLSIALFAYFEQGVYSVVYGKFVFVSLWVLLFIKAPVARFGLAFELTTIMHLLKTSTQLMFSELFRATRLHADVFIAGKLLAPEMFGLYSFAKSAGVGLSQSLNNAYNAALYPHVCQLNREKKLANKYTHLFLLTCAIGSLFLLQAAAAPLYIPLLFDAKWGQAITCVSLLCISAFPNLLLDTFCNLQRAQARFKQELTLRTVFSSLSIALLFVLQPATPEQFALTVLAGSFCWPLWYLFRQQLLPLLPFSSRFNSMEKGS